MNNTTAHYSDFLINNTNTSSVPVLDFARDYFLSLPKLVTNGDLVGIIVSLMLLFVILLLINKLSSILLHIIKKTIIFIITILILIKYVPVIISKIAVEGFTVNNILLGVAGFLFCVFAFSLALIALFKKTKHAILHTDSQADQTSKAEQKLPLSFDSITKDKSLHHLLIYLIVAEFGVFSSVTLAAPNVKVGISFLAIFIVASLIFIKQSYKSYKHGLIHLAIAFTIGFTLSLILGVFWGDHQLSELISINYFSSDSLVALITGMAVSLFASSRG
jgi:hypothetical protein